MGRQTDDGLTMNQLAERNAEYVMTIAELEEKCAALAAKLSMINDLMGAAEQVNKLAQEAAEKLVQECNALTAENAGLKSALNDILQPDAAVLEKNHRVRALDAMETPATDAFLAEVRASARNEGINYAASRLAAAFNHGFLDKPVSEVLDVTRMILSAKEDLTNDPLPTADGLSGEYAEKAIEEWAAQLRKGAAL
ncbi:hypothetical protein NVB27_004900 [Salmonella enterica]|uniref:hypothetical protein n=1 Tax=Salmonella enterica TaxID=28901 RepID=UPI0003BCC9AF|nr:hypothetical protein [Salmonella enterica]ESJ22084.1 hypothetical protein SED60170_03743 [Salmonella enterica subsp. diarizonae serovar 60:r:e,n,x,z15 str. 01-0170]EIQ9371696.1 hypothetical protein [Salmonella enterica]EJD1356302.1 hypothetical protein [Salmonella enterica]EJP0619625.1 hypothetical protein [Salmonella enterica]EJW1071560.1 hypothetical protein [Salmonella enterica]